LKIFVFDIVVHKKDGWSPAHFVASEGHTESLAALISSGANVNIPDLILS
jgi:ankyrin repeat protein